MQKYNSEAYDVVRTGDITNKLNENFSGTLGLEKKYSCFR